MLRVTGFLTARVNVDDEITDIDIPGEDFKLEEDDWRNLGEGATQYEALYVYAGEDFEIQFQATYQPERGVRGYHFVTTSDDVIIVSNAIEVELDDEEEDEDHQ